MNLSTLSGAFGWPHRLSRRSFSENAVPANKRHYESVVLSCHVNVGMLTFEIVEQQLWPTYGVKCITKTRR